MPRHDRFELTVILTMATTGRRISVRHSATPAEATHGPAPAFIPNQVERPPRFTDETGYLDMSNIIHLGGKAAPEAAPQVGFAGPCGRSPMHPMTLHPRSIADLTGGNRKRLSSARKPQGLPADLSVLPLPQHRSYSPIAYIALGDSTR